MIMIFDIFLFVLGLCFLIAGWVGCILPVVPGPPLSFIALLLLQATRFADFSGQFLMVTATITVVITILDFVLPAWGTRKWGGSRAGTVGAILGILVGLFFPPLGIILGPFAGAVVFELITGKNTGAALRSGFGSFLGFILGAVMKLTICAAFTYYYFKEFIVSFLI